MRVSLELRFSSMLSKGVLWRALLLGIFTWAMFLFLADSYGEYATNMVLQIMAFLFGVLIGARYGIWSEKREKRQDAINRGTDLPRRTTLAFFTVLFSFFLAVSPLILTILPTLLGYETQLSSQERSTNLLTFSTVITILVVGLGGMVAGIGLWRGTWWGYRAGIFIWSYIVAWAVYSILRIPQPYELDALIVYGLEVIAGSIIVFVLFRSLRKANQYPDINVSQ